jgi:hypothetical protein
VNRLLLLGAAALALTACHHTEEVREIGYKGKARGNPWLAAERLVGRMDLPVRSVISWTNPLARDAVWVMPASILGNESFTRRMESWVRQGGHLIVLVENADQETSDWAGDYPAPVLEPALLSMLERARIELKPQGSSKGDIIAEQIVFNDRNFKVDAQSKASVARAGESAGVCASVKHGRGRITVVTDGRLFRNRWIADHEHAALFAALVDASRNHSTVGFMRGSGLSLWVLTRKYLWPILIGLGLWVILWLWKNFTRFGPLEAPVPPAMRGYEHHLEALGDFQWRLDRAASLLTGLRQQVVELGQRTRLQAGCRGDDFYQFLAGRSGLPRERVCRALEQSAPADPALLTRLTADLQQLLQVLHSPSLT